MSAQQARVVDLQEFRRKREAQTAGTRARPVRTWMPMCWMWVMVWA